MVRWSSATERIQIVTSSPPSLASDMEIGNEESKMNGTKRGKKKKWPKRNSLVLWSKADFIHTSICLPMLLQSIRFRVVKRRRRRRKENASHSTKPCTPQHKLHRKKMIKKLLDFWRKCMKWNETRASTAYYSTYSYYAPQKPSIQWTNLFKLHTKSSEKFFKRYNHDQTREREKKFNSESAMGSKWLCCVSHRNRTIFDRVLLSLQNNQKKKLSAFWHTHQLSLKHESQFLDG